MASIPRAASELPVLCAKGLGTLGAVVGLPEGGIGAVLGWLAGSSTGSAYCEALRQRLGDIMLRDPNVPQKKATEVDPNEPIWDSPLEYDDILWSILTGLNPLDY